MQTNAYQEGTKMNTEVNGRVHEEYWYASEYKAPLKIQRVPISFSIAHYWIARNLLYTSQKITHNKILKYDNIL